MPTIVPVSDVRFTVDCDIVIVGGGAAGLVSALRARESGASVLVVERDSIPRGSTALSAGLIPAPCTRFQRQAGITDSIDLFADDILRKAKHQPDPDAVHLLASTIGPAVEWLADRHGLPFSVIDNFSYPGHSAMRMHGLPGRSGLELMEHLSAAADRAGVDILTDAHVTTLVTDGIDRIAGVGLTRPDGTGDWVKTRATILACNGYGGNPDLVARHVPDMAGALYFGHPGNQGDAVLWGEALGARRRHLSGYQGHGSVAQPHGILITWAAITEGGFHVGPTGRRFFNEARGYSEAAADVIAAGGLAWVILDARIAGIARQFEDFRTAEQQGAIIVADDVDSLAARTSLPEPALRRSLAEVSAAKDAGVTDAFGRNWQGAPHLAPPYAAVRVTGALFHTQGGLAVDSTARVLRIDGSVFANLYAAGGAACGVSGTDASGYLSGNGLLTAVAYGVIAGEQAARNTMK